MAITIEYSPIAAALGLATKAGEGQRRQKQQQADAQFQEMVNAMQARADAKRSQEISQAIQEQGIGQRADQAADALHFRNVQADAQNALGQARLADSTQNHATTHSIAQQNADTATQRASQTAQYEQQRQGLAQTKYDTQQTAIDQLPDAEGNLIRAQGHLPGAGQDETRLLIQEYRRLDQQLRQATKDQQASAYDPNDLKKLLAEQSSDEPRAIKGMETAYSTAGKRAEAINTRMQQIDAKLNESMTNMGQPTAMPAAAVSPPVPPQNSASDQQPRILAQERNPQDGKMWGYDANQGSWIPLE